MNEGNRRRTRREEANNPTQERYGDASAQALYEDAPAADVIATNSAVKLACTLAAMCSPFALFRCYAEKSSRAIRSFSVQSVALSVTHLVCAAVLLLGGSMLGVVPYLGFLINLICWLVYLAIVMVLLALRVRMMLAAWRGVKYILPLVGRMAERFV